MYIRIKVNDNKVCYFAEVYGNQLTKKYFYTTEYIIVLEPSHIAE